MPHSIFVRETSGTRTRPPLLLAYDIAEKTEAEEIVRSIAASYRSNGITADTAVRWFVDAGRKHEIYTWSY